MTNTPSDKAMKLTLWRRLCIAWEVLTITSGHGHTAQLKQLSTFQQGYDAGRNDCLLSFHTGKKGAKQ